MPQILVWECPETHKFFKTKRKYLSHLKTLAAARLERKKEERIVRNARKIIADAKERIVTFEEVADFVKENIQTSIQLGGRMRGDWYNDRQKEECRKFAFEELEFVNMRYSLLVSNSHSAPAGKTTNWHRDTKLPLGYPGWSGSVRGKTNGANYPGFFSELFNVFRIDTGSGSGGHRSFEYQVIFWEDDWPGLKRQRVWNILKDVDNI